MRRLDFLYITPVTDTASSSISLWSTTKKKPLFSHPEAHGVHEHISETDGTTRNPRWITSIAAVPYSDLFASGTCILVLRAPFVVSSSLTTSLRIGSWDGSIRLWKLDSSLRSFTPLRTLPAPGVVNSLQLLRTPPGTAGSFSWVAPNTTTSLNGNNTLEEGKASRKQDILLVVGMGTEPRLGRWMSIKEEGARNGALVFALTRTTSASVADTLSLESGGSVEQD